MRLSNYNFQNTLNDFLLDEEGDGGGEIGMTDVGGSPLTTTSVGLPKSGKDAFRGKTYSNLEGATKGYVYDHSSKKKRKLKLGRSFMDHVLKNGNIVEDTESPIDFAMDISVKKLAELFGEPVYEFGSKTYTVKFYRKGDRYSFGKMFFIGNDSFALRFNKSEGSEHEVDSISFWSNWSTEIINDDLNFSITPDADVITEGLSLDKCFSIAKQIFKNQKAKFLKIDNIKIEKKGKPANKEFEKELGASGKKSVSFTELLDFANQKGYNVIEPSDGSLNISLVVPMKMAKKEHVIPHKSEYSKSMDSEKFVEDGKLKLTSVNIQNFVSNTQYAEEILEFFRSLFKDNLINKLSFEAIVFASKVRESKHPNWLKVLVPKA